LIYVIIKGNNSYNNLKIYKKLSPELLHQMGQYLALRIPRTRRFPGIIEGHALRWHSFMWVDITNSFNNHFLVNHYFKCIDSWHGTSLGTGDSSLFK